MILLVELKYLLTCLYKYLLRMRLRVPTVYHEGIKLAQSAPRHWSRRSIPLVRPATPLATTLTVYMHLATRLPSSRVLPSVVVLLSSAFSTSANTCRSSRPHVKSGASAKMGGRGKSAGDEKAYYRRDGVRITHDPYAPDMASKYGEPGETDSDGFDPYADSVGAGIYSGTVQRRECDGSVVIGTQYQNHNPRPGPVYSKGGYTPVSRAIASFRREMDSGGGDPAGTTLGKLLEAHPDLVNDGAPRFPSPPPNTHTHILHRSGFYCVRVVCGCAASSLNHHSHPQHRPRSRPPSPIPHPPSPEQWQRAARSPYTLAA